MSQLRRIFPRGQAALIALLFVSTMGGVSAIALSSITLTRLQLSRQTISSFQAYEAAEGGLEDAAYRLIDPDIGDPATSYTVPLGSSSITMTTAISGSEATITGRSTVSGQTKALSSRLIISQDVVSFAYGLQAGPGGVQLDNSASVIGSVLADGDIIGNSSNVVTGGVFVTNAITAAATTLYADASPATQYFADVSGNRDIAQAFVAPSTGTINRLSLYLSKVGSPSDLEVRLTNNGSSRPGDTSLADQTYTAASAPTTARWVDITFDTPATVTAGTTYWIVLDQGNWSTTNKWNWSKTVSSNSSAIGCLTANWSNSGSSCTDLTKDLLLKITYGAAGRKIEGIRAGGASQANLFESTYVNGVLCDNSGTPGGTCTDTALTPPVKTCDDGTTTQYPICDDQIQGWQDEITDSGCTYSGTFDVGNGEDVELGPCKIIGDLAVNGGGILRMTGKLWVTGEVRVLTGGIVKLDNTHADNVGVIISGNHDASSGDITIGNTSQVNGKDGVEESYMIVISTRQDTSRNSITVSNNNDTNSLYFAPNTNIYISSSATVKGLTGYTVRLGNSASISYEIGLAGLPISSGPTGGWQITEWQEVP